MTPDVARRVDPGGANLLQGCGLDAADVGHDDAVPPAQRVDDGIAEMIGRYGGDDEPDSVRLGRRRTALLDRGCQVRRVVVGEPDVDLKRSQC